MRNVIEFWLNATPSEYAKFQMESDTRDIPGLRDVYMDVHRVTRKLVLSGVGKNVICGDLDIVDFKEGADMFCAELSGLIRYVK